MLGKEGKRKQPNSIELENEAMHLIMVYVLTAGQSKSHLNSDKLNPA